jgi:hypothetical protein
VVRNSFKKRFVDQPAGRGAVKLKVMVSALQARGGQANCSADGIVVLEGVTSRPLSENPEFVGILAASRAVVPATPIGMIVGLAALAVIDLYVSIRPKTRSTTLPCASLGGFFASDQEDSAGCDGGRQRGRSARCRRPAAWAWRPRSGPRGGEPCICLQNLRV